MGTGVAIMDPIMDPYLRIMDPIMDPCVRIMAPLLESIIERQTILSLSDEAATHQVR